MLKITGLCLIIVSSFVAAIYYSYLQKKKLTITQAFLDFIIYIKHRIIFFREEIDDIYSSYENVDLEKSGFMDLLAESSFENAIVNERIKHMLSSKSINALMDFGKKLGKSNLEGQRSNCDVCTEALESEVQRMVDEAPQKGKVYSSLCIIAGLVAVLLLL